MALKFLGSAKRHEANIERALAQQDNLSMVLDTMMGANMTKEVVEAHRAANVAFKNIQSKLEIDDVEEVMTDIETSMTEINEISSAIARPLNTGMDLEYTEEQLESELDDMCLEVFNDPVVSAARPSAAAVDTSPARAAAAPDVYTPLPSFHVDSLAPPAPLPKPVRAVPSFDDAVAVSLGKAPAVPAAAPRNDEEEDRRQIAEFRKQMLA